jgi:hypothetical protein
VEAVCEGYDKIMLGGLLIKLLAHVRLSEELPFERQITELPQNLESNIIPFSQTSKSSFFYESY